MVNGFHSLTSITCGDVVVYKRGDTGPSEGTGDEIEGLCLARMAGGEVVVVVLEDCNFDFFVVGYIDTVI